MEEKIPGLNEILPSGGHRQPGGGQATPQPAARAAPGASAQPNPAAPPQAAPAARPASPAPSPTPGQQSGHQPASGASPVVASSFDFNQPTIVAVLYLSAPFFGVTGLVGLVLAYVWRSEKPNGWEATHYTYMIRAFWIWFVGFIVGFILTFVVIGIFVILAVYAMIIVRAVLSIMRAQKQEPMPEPETWLA